MRNTGAAYTPSHSGVCPGEYATLAGAFDSCLFNIERRSFRLNILIGGYQSAGLMWLETGLSTAEFTFLTGSRAASRAANREDLFRCECFFHLFRLCRGATIQSWSIKTTQVWKSCEVLQAGLARQSRDAGVGLKRQALGFLSSSVWTLRVIAGLGGKLCNVEIFMHGLSAFVDFAFFERNPIAAYPADVNRFLRERHGQPPKSESSHYTIPDVPQMGAAEVCAKRLRQYKSIGYGPVHLVCTARKPRTRLF